MDLSHSLNQLSKCRFDCILFDLDDTLYSSTIGLNHVLRRNIEEFLMKRYDFSVEKASTLRQELFKTYGSTLAGLRALGHAINADDYHSFVHGSLPYELIKPDIQLRNVLKCISQKKLIFTNSDRIHAKKVLKRLGIEDCFEGVVCFETLNPNISKSRDPKEYPVVLKPSMDAMRIAVTVANVEPHRILFFDDNDRNIVAGKAIGLRTVLVGKPRKGIDADYVVDTIIHLKQKIPEIWSTSDDIEDKGDDRMCLHNASSISDMEILASTAPPVGA